MTKLRLRPLTPIFDSLWLKEQLKEYDSPRAKISRLIKEGSLIRIRKGLYCMPDEEKGVLSSPYMIANYVWSPSYVSLESALSYHRMIPERVEGVYSMARRDRSKTYNTPLGVFSYRPLALPAYPIGVDLIEEGPKDKFFMATPEKALCDRLAEVDPFAKTEDLIIYITEGLRIEEDTLRDLDKALVRRIAEAYKKPILKMLGEMLWN